MPEDGGETTWFNRNRRETVLSERKVRARILVAEDNVVNQRLIVSILRTQGYQTDIVSNGTKAVEAAGSGNYDLVIMDVQMPELSGLDATIRIREAERTGPHIPIIGLTAYALFGDREHMIEAGMNACLTKPVDRLELLDLISAHLKASHG